MCPSSDLSGQTRPMTGTTGGAPRTSSNHPEAARPTVLIVEDDPSIAGPLVTGLAREGFAPVAVSTGQAALAASPTDAVVLDLGLPDGHGFEVCRALRERSAVPIIILTARDDEIDRVAGLEIGADDYLVKPIGLRELAARLRAVLRRVHPAPTPPALQVLGALAIDRRSHRVLIDGEPLALSPKEFDLLALLAVDPGAMVSRRTILAEVWDPHYYGTTKTVDVHIASLRRKLGHPEWIETSRGVGFRLTVTP